MSQQGKERKKKLSFLARENKMTGVVRKNERVGRRREMKLEVRVAAKGWSVIGGRRLGVAGQVG